MATKIRTFSNILSLALALPLCLGGISKAQEDEAPAEIEEIEAVEEAEESSEEADKPKKSDKKKKKKADKDKKADKKKKEDDGNYISQNIPGWGNPEAAQRSLASGIMNALKGDSPENVLKFIESPKNRLMVAQYMLAQYDRMTPPDMAATSRKKLTDAINRLPGEIEQDNAKLKTLRGKERTAFAAAIKAKKASIKTMEAELKNMPWSLKELNAHRDGRVVLKQVTGNLEWMENISFSGPCVAPGRALHIIANIAKKHPDVYKDKTVRDIATAVGIEFARYNWDFEKALIRADYYIEKWKEGRLNTLFDTLPMYLRRIVCGCKGDNIAGERTSLEWALDNVHVSAERYMGAPHRNGYRLFNLYGDSIHGADYYKPWDHVFGNNFFTRSLYVGCVCGGISHFGAFSAVANGVPALTCGEPGHCAYVLWLNGNWVPGNTVSWERGLHWQPVLNMWSAFSSLHLGSELYTKLDSDTHVSNVYRVLAHHAVNTKKDKQAISYFQDSTSAQPINIAVWQEYNNFLAANKAGDMKLLSNLQDNLCYTVATRYPEVVSEFLSAWVYPKMMAAKMPPKELMTRFHVFWDNVSKMGPERWRIEKFGRRQIELLAHQPPPDGKEIPPPAPERALPVFEMMMHNLAAKADYIPVMMGWGDEMGKSLGGSNGSAVAEMSKAIAKTGVGAMGGSGNANATGAMILAAAKAKDIATFQRLGSNASDKADTVSMPEFEHLPGKLLSEDGLLITSSTCNHDSPVSHWGVLRTSGGRFHTAKDENAWATVMLPKPSYVNGVIIVTNGGNHQRLNNMIVQVSNDGMSWQNASKDLGECRQQVIKVEFPEVGARFVRILRKGGPDFFHLYGIYCYGRDGA